MGPAQRLTPERALSAQRLHEANFMGSMTIFLFAVERK